MNRIKKILSFILCCFLVVSLGSSAFALSGAGEETVSLRFCTADGTEYTLDFPYSDAFFRADDGRYSHDICRASTGLTAAAFRKGTETFCPDYFEQTGFTNVDASAYETLPGTDTIANCIASKKIDRFTLIAVGVCGGNYEKEWASNFKVGDEERSVGFNEAAQTVNERIRQYIKDNNLTGELRLWVTGQSRGGATANIVAADMTDSGLFSKVYGYSFGTPRVTRNPGNYDNIFCILSKDDIVPKVPLPDWGYERFGTDLYLLSQECDYDYPTGAHAAASAAVDGVIRNNPMLYDQYRVIMNYIYELLPTSKSYEMYLQEPLRELISSKGTLNAIELLREAMPNFIPNNDYQKKELDAFLQYLDTLAGMYLLHGNVSQIENGSWDVTKTAGQNLMIEHTVTTYISWILGSEDGKDIFSDDLEFIHLVFSTAAPVEIWNGKGLVATIKPDGFVDYAEGRDNGVYPACDRDETQVCIDVPLDDSFTIRYKPARTETGTVIATKYSSDSVVPEVVFHSEVKTDRNNSTFIFTFDDDDDVISVEENGCVKVGENNITDRLPMSVINRAEKVNMLDLSLAQLVKVLLAVLVFLLVNALLLLSLFIYRKIKGKERSPKQAFLVTIANIAFMTCAELCVWFFAPAVAVLNDIVEIISFVIILLYALRSDKKIPVLLMTVCMVLIAALNWYFTKEITTLGAIILIARNAALLFWAIRLNKPNKTSKTEVPSDEVRN